jgi:hypothetical protein
MKAAQIECFFATLRAANPHPQTELAFTSVFELLAAVLLSAQATDVGVNKATRHLFPVAPTPAKMLALGVEGLESYIKTIGLYRTKAKHLIQTCQILVEQHGGQVPRSREALEALPGVGRKTANVVLNRGLWRTHHGGRYPHLPRRQPNRLGPWQERAGSRKRTAQAHPTRLPGGCPPLADSAWPLCLPGTPAPLRSLPGGRLLRLQTQKPQDLKR